MVKESYPNILEQLDYITWVSYKPLPLLEDNIRTSYLQKGGRWSGWSTAEEASCMNASITLLNAGTSNLYTEGNIFIIISIPFIESNFDYDYNHIIRGPPKEYMYEYLI